MTTPADWSDRVGRSWAEEWRRTDRSFAGLAPSLDAAIRDAAPAGAFAAIDVGCGAGTTSFALAAARADAAIVGVDVSADLVAAALQRRGAAARPGFVVGDAVAFAAARAGAVDLILSRHGVMFFDDPAQAFATFHRAMRPGGRIVFSCFAAIADNPWATLVAPAPAASGRYAPGPFAFADEAATRALLDAAGWVDATATRVAFAYRAGAGADPVEDALAFLARIGPSAAWLRDAPPGEHADRVARLRTALAAQRKHDVIDFPAAAWIWTARATGERP